MPQTITTEASASDGRTAGPTDVTEYRSRHDAALLAPEFGTWLWDIPTDAVRGDQNLDAMFGLAPTAAGRRPIADYFGSIHPEDRPRVSASIERTIATGARYEEEYRTVAGGRERWVSARGFLRRDSQGAPLEFSGVLVDISRQKALDVQHQQLLEQLKTQARIFDTTLSAITDFAYIFDVQGRFLYVNKALLDLWGLRLEQVVGKNFFDLQYPDALATRLQQQIQQVIATRTSLVDETPYTSPTGAGGVYEYIFSPVFAQDGSVEVVAGSTRDISARKQAVDALHRRTAQFETLLKNAPLGVYLLGADFRILEMNPAARLLFGATEDLIGRDFVEVIRVLWPRDYADEIVRVFRHTLATGEPYFAPERVEARADRQVTEVYEWQVHRIPLPDGLFGVVCYFRDISTQVNARRTLEKADREKNEFLAMLAHELRNPLAPIRNAAEFVARAREQDEQTQKSMGIIRRQISHLTHLVDDLLDVSRISQGRIDLKIESLELAAVVAQAVETVGPLLREKEHNLTIVSDYERLGVRGDPNRLAQCLANILNNAAKYTDAGGRIELKFRPDGDEAVISICDNGTGVSAELLPRLFDLFVQGDRTLDRAQGGLGIGLAIVKRLVEMHGGKVTAYSAGSGQGTTFEIRLPRTETIEESQRQLSSGKSPPRRVLIVDDNIDAANSLSLLVGFEGHETRAVYNAEDALSNVETFRPSIILLDIGLPRMDGYEVAGRIRAMPSGKAIRLVAVTGYGQPDDRQRTREAGFDIHLVKPIDLAALERLLSE
jgi:PAS domain S-box-containing protein